MKDSYFVVYDENDEIIFFIPDVYCLQKYTTVPLYHLSFNFENSTDNFINIVIDGKRYKLFKFDE